MEQETGTAGNFVLFHVFHAFFIAYDNGLKQN